MTFSRGSTRNQGREEKEKKQYQIKWNHYTCITQRERKDLDESIDAMKAQL